MRAWVKAQTSILVVQVISMRVIVHATSVEAPTEKTSIEKEKQKLILGRYDHDRGLPWGRKKEEETSKEQDLGSLKRRYIVSTAAERQR